MGGQPLTEYELGVIEVHAATVLKNSSDDLAYAAWAKATIPDLAAEIRRLQKERDAILTAARTFCDEIANMEER